jgi:hypothetical protein
MAMRVWEIDQAVWDESNRAAFWIFMRAIGEVRFGPPDKTVKDCLSTVKDQDHMIRMIHRAVDAANWQEILNTP